MKKNIIMIILVKAIMKKAIMEQLDEGYQCNFISIQVDETTDISTYTQIVLVL